MALARVAGHVVMWAIWALPGIAFGAAAVSELSDPPVNVAVRCSSATAEGHCLSTSPARVTHVDPEGVVTAETDAGEVVVELAGEPVPAAGRRVDVEYWDRELVSLLDPVSARRYRTTDWDQGWAADGGGVIFMLVWSLFWVGMPVAFAVSWLGNRRASSPVRDPELQDVNARVPGG